LYWVEGNNKQSFEEAYKIAAEWDYSLDPKSKIAMGIFYQVKKPTFAEKLGIK